MTERTLNDMQLEFDTGTRVKDPETNKHGIVLMRDHHLGAWVLYDGEHQPLHHGSAAALVGLGPRMTVEELSDRRTAAVDCSSATFPGTDRDQRLVDPFDTGSLESLSEG